jgi:hypothetical protein
VTRPPLQSLNLLQADFAQMAKDTTAFGKQWAGWMG